MELFEVKATLESSRNYAYNTWSVFVNDWDEAHKAKLELIAQGYDRVSVTPLGLSTTAPDVVEEINKRLK
jgi:hypothetical protein